MLRKPSYFIMYLSFGENLSLFNLKSYIMFFAYFNFVYHKFFYRILNNQRTIVESFMAPAEISAKI